MLDANIRITLLPGTEDPPFSRVDYQAELQQFARSLEEEGIAVTPRKYIPEMESGVLDTTVPSLLGEYVLPLAQAGFPIVIAALVSWITARDNRRVLLRIGNIQKLDDIEVEARTHQDVDHILQKVNELAQYLGKSKRSTD